jgi:hypothetical protein
MKQLIVSLAIILGSVVGARSTTNCCKVKASCCPGPCCAGHMQK